MVREEGGGWPKNDLLHTKLHATLHVLFYVGAATWANVVAFAAHFHNIRQHMLAITYATGGHRIGLANWLQLCFGFNSNAHFAAWRWPGLLLHKVLLLSGPAREKERAEPKRFCCQTSSPRAVKIAERTKRKSKTCATCAACGMFRRWPPLLSFLVCPSLRLPFLSGLFAVFKHPHGSHFNSFTANKFTADAKLWLDSPSSLHICIWTW